jgi:hypothetical protein
MEVIKDPQNPITLKEKREEHWRKIEELDGRIITLPNGYMGTERLTIPDGFVVDGGLDQEIRDQILADVIPFRPNRVPTMRQNADRRIEEARKLLDTDSVILLALQVPDYRNDWTIAFVATRDLFTKDPYYLLMQAEHCEQEGSSELAKSKMCAYKAVTGKL